MYLKFNKNKIIKNEKLQTIQKPIIKHLIEHNNLNKSQSINDYVYTYENSIKNIDQFKLFLDILKPNSKIIIPKQINLHSKNLIYYYNDLLFLTDFLIKNNEIVVNALYIKDIYQLTYILDIIEKEKEKKIVKIHNNPIINIEKFNNYYEYSITVKI
jgi:hypothetical protein